MYQPPHFREDDRERQHALMREHPFALLVTAGAGGLMANGAPFVLDAARLRSRCKNSPFDGARLSGLVSRTFVAGKQVFERG